MHYNWYHKLCPTRHYNSIMVLPGMHQYVVQKLTLAIIHIPFPITAGCVAYLVLFGCWLQGCKSWPVHYDPLIWLWRLRLLLCGLRDVSLPALIEVFKGRRPRVQLSRPKKTPRHRLLGLVCPLFMLLGWILFLQQGSKELSLGRLCYFSLLRCSDCHLSFFGTWNDLRNQKDFCS